MERIAPVLSVIRSVSSYVWLALFVVIYLVLNASLPVSSRNLAELHLNIGQYRLFLLSALLPYCFIWFTGFFAYNRLRSYRRLIVGEREEQAFARITNGVTVMAWGLVLPAVIGAALHNLAVTHPSFAASVTIIDNYIMLAVSLTAFTLIGLGSRSLSDMVKHRPSYLGLRIFVFAFIALGVVYSYLTLRAWYAGGNPYHLSLVATLTTIMLPYLYAWFLGFLACIELFVYTRNVKGLLYQQALGQLTTGLAVTIVSSIFIQYLTIALAERLPSLVSMLVSLYVFLALQALGFILVALGANRLKRIEEI